MFAVTVILFFIGYSSPAVTLLTGDITNPVKPVQLIPGANNSGVPITNINSVLVPDNYTIIGSILLLFVGAAVLSFLLGGFGAIYIVPIFIIIAIMHFLFFPFDFFYAAPQPFNFLILGAFNLLTVMMVIEFIRGSA
jgi:hypothetical protein